MRVDAYIKYYRILSRAYFHLPLLVYFLDELGYSFKQIIVLILTYSVTSLIFLLLKNKVYFNNPKKQLYLSEVSKLIGLLCFIFMSRNIYFLIFGQIGLSISYSLAIGVDTKIINDNFSLNKRNDLQRNTNALMFPSLLLSGIIGAIGYVVSPVVPFVLTFICSLFIILITYKTSLIIEDKLINKEPINSLKVSSIHLYYAFSRGVVLTLFVAVIPYMLLLKNVSVVTFVVILSSYTLCGYLSSKYYVKLPYKFNQKLMLSIGFIVFGCIALWINSLLSILLCLILFGLGAGLVRPITMERINDQYGIRLLEILYFLINIIILGILLI